MSNRDRRLPEAVRWCVRTDEGNEFLLYATTRKAAAWIVRDWTLARQRIVSVERA